METTVPRSPLLPAAFAYAGAAALALLVLPHLETPLVRYGHSAYGALVLGRDPVSGLWWGLGVGALLTAVGQVLTRRTAWGRRLEALLARLVRGLHPVDAILLAVLSALAEELVFRAILLPYAGLWGSSALFGLAHWVPREGLWPWGVWAFVAGLALGGTALATGGILAPTTAHFVVNAVGLIVLSRGRR
ncbi:MULTISPECIES: CPBP family intramembrane glutamic endopeptidase [Deferrisoma]